MNEPWFDYDAKFRRRTETVTNENKLYNLAPRRAVRSTFEVSFKQSRQIIWDSGGKFREFASGYFWGQQKTKDEIVRYCAQMLFPSEDISISKQRIEVISEELPLVVIHNFLTDDMCELIKQAAEQHGDMKRSTIGE